MISPPGSIVSFAVGMGDAAILAVDTIIISRRADELIRQEYTAELEQKVKEIDGSEATFDYTAGNTKWQIFDDCGPETARKIVPDDDVLEDIFQRLDLVSIQMKGTDSIASEVQAVETIFKTHLPKYSIFETLQKYVRSDISIDKLKELQLEDYSFLEDSGLTVNAAAMLGSFTNCLIKKFEIEPTIEYPNDAAASTSTVFLSWTAEIEAIVITFGTDSTWRGQ